MKLSIIIPCFNEEKTLEQIVAKVLNFKTLVKEIIIVDDYSIDNSRTIIQKISEENEEVKFFFKDKNEGKGSAIRKGFEISTGDILLIQDADLEYDPSDYDKLIQPFIEADADVVYGGTILCCKSCRALLPLCCNTPSQTSRSLRYPLSSPSAQRW